MAKNLIRKNQLHPDIADLVSGYGDDFFVTSDQLNNAIDVSQQIITQGAVLVSGDQNISGLKNFVERPTVNGSGVLLQGEAGSEYIFTENLQVNLSNGKTFGKFQDGDEIPALGKTTSEVIKLAIAESIAPDVNLTSPTTIQFNQTSINNQLNFNYTINTLDANVVSASLEWRRNNAGNWTVLSTSTANPGNFPHILTDSQFNSQPFNYRYIVTDSESQSATGTFNITPGSYIAPTLSNITSLSTPADLGNISTTLAATINRQSSLVPLQSYQLQYSTDNSTWINIGSAVNSNNSTQSFNVTHNDPNLINSTNLYYRVRVTDSFTDTYLTIGSRAFTHRIYLGYSTSPSLSTVSQIEQLTSIDSILSNGKARTVNNVTATQTQYTYYCYSNGAGDLQGITDGQEAFLTAFTKQNDIIGQQNSFGANVAYRVYVSNAPGAFGGVNLTFN
jgi:hypothetical protein